MNFFNGETAAGTWRLTLSDHVSQDFGSITGWSIKMEVADAAIPEPSMALPVLLALGAIGLHRRAPPLELALPTVSQASLAHGG